MKNISRGKMSHEMLCIQDICKQRFIDWAMGKFHARYGNCEITTTCLGELHLDFGGPGPGLYYGVSFRNYLCAIMK